jgi:hypothetical protein
VEDEVHTLFNYTAQVCLLELRSEFLDTLADCDPGIRAILIYGLIPNYDFMLRAAVSQFRCLKSIFTSFYVSFKTPLGISL